MREVRRSNRRSSILFLFSRELADELASFFITLDLMEKNRTLFIVGHAGHTFPYAGG